MNDTTPVLRTIALAMLAACAIGLPLAAFPSVDIFKDANDCFGRVLSWHHGSGGTCTPHYTYWMSRTSALPVLPALLGIALGATAMRRWPRPVVGMLWSLVAFALVVVCAGYTFDVEIFSLDHKTYRSTGRSLGLLYMAIGLTSWSRSSRCRS